MNQPAFCVQGYRPSFLRQQFRYRVVATLGPRGQIPLELTPIGVVRPAKPGLPMKIIRDSRAGGCEAQPAGLIPVRPDHLVAFAADRVPTDSVILLRHCAGLD